MLMALIYLAIFLILPEDKLSTMPTFSRFSLLLTISLLSIICLKCGSKNKDRVQKTSGTSGLIAVQGIVIRTQTLDNIVRSSGTVFASESVELAAEVAGRIEKIYFREGTHVKKNALLVKINDDDLQAQLKKLQLQIQLSKEQTQRQKQLFEKNLISREQYDISLSQLNTQLADSDNLVASIRKREIRAPFDGIVGLRYVSEGGYLAPAMRIASIQKVNPVKVDFAISEKYAGSVSVGDPVQFRSDESKLQFMGKLIAIEPKIDQVTRTLQLRALCDNKSEKIFPGAYVQTELQLRKIRDAILIPTQALIPVLKGQTVFVFRNGVVASVPVNTGIRTASTVQITQGLSVGDTIITTGIMQVRPGSQVKLTVR